MTRVAITGIGMISCFGRGREAALEAARSGRSGIRTIESIDSSALACRIAGEVPAAALGSQYPGFDRFTRFALLAALDAAEDAGLGEASIDGGRIATLVGTALGGSTTLDAAYERMYRKGLTRFPPATIPHAMYNAAASAVAAELGARGPSYSVVSACASGAHAIGQAALWIRMGLADVVFAGASDAPLTPGVIRGWESMRVLAIDNEHPEEACRPFSADRKGLVLAEGAAILVLESMESARRRGATIQGEIAGFGMSSDAGHLTDPSPDGAARAMSEALRDGAIDPAAVEYINAHGTGTRANDVVETAAIKQVFGARARQIPVSSTKSMHGHAMGASGAIEIALSLVALNHGVLPPTINLELPDPACDLDYVPNLAREQTVRVFLSNSFGFGGMNGVVAVRTAV